MRAALGLVAALCACASPPSDRLADRPADELVVLLDASVRSLDPRFALDSTSNRLSRLVFASLVSVDNATLAPELELAEWLRPDPDDATVWRARVRDGARFHDGAPITGHDVAFTFRSLLDPAVGSPLRGEFSTRLRRVEVDRDDPQVVLFELWRPFATFRTDLVMGIVPAHALRDAPGQRFAPGAVWVGSGPWRLSAPPSTEEVSLERVGPLPAPGALRRLRFKVARDENVRLLSLLAGSSDAVFGGVTPALLDVLDAEPDLRVVRAPSISLTYLGLNLRRPELSERRVREALALALDREALIAHRYGGRAVLASGMFAPTHWAHAPELPSWPHDPAEAERRLDAAGLPRDPATGVRFELDLHLSTNRFRLGLAQLLARQWAEIGVATRLRAHEFSTFFADVRQGRFDVFLLQLPEPVEPDMLRWMFDGLATPVLAGDAGAPSPYARFDRRAFAPGLGTLLRELPEGRPPRDDAGDCAAWARQGLREGTERLALRAAGLDPGVGTGNRTFMAHARLDCLLARGRHEPDRDRRYALYAEAQRIVAAQVPIIPLWHEDQIAVVRTDLVGLTLLPSGRLAPLSAARRQRAPR